MKKLLLIFTCCICVNNIGYCQNQIAQKVNLEFRLSNPTDFDLFEKGEPINERHLNHISEGVSLNIKTNVLDKIIEESPQAINIQLPNPLNTSLELYRSEVFSHDFKIETSDGKFHEAPKDILFYRGIIKKDENSIASVTVSKDEILIMYSDREGNKRIQKTEGNSYIAFEDKNIRNKPEFQCGVKDNDHPNDATMEEYNDNVRYTTEECATVYVVCDYESYKDNNFDLRTTYLWVAKLWNDVVTLYENEMIPVRVSNMFVYTTLASDPFKNLNTTELLLEKFEELYGINTNGYGWFKHLMTTRLGGGRGNLWGDSNWTGQCPNSNFCNYPHNAVTCGLLLNPLQFPTYSETVHFITHELGHNMGSPHTQACRWNGNWTAIDGCVSTEGGNCPLPPVPPNGGTIMSYCHFQPGDVNFSLGFGPQPGDRIRCYFNNLKNKCTLGNCLTEGTRCAEAINLPCGSSLQGTNTIGSWDKVPDCSSQLISGPGIWYKFTGDGQNTIISTCSSYTYNTAIHIYKGSCNSLLCITANDDYCGQGSQLAFPTLNGTVYYVLVEGAGGGNFTITRTCSTGSNANDLYSNATSLGCGQSISGNTYWASVDNNAPSCNSVISSPGVWYKFTGNGQNTVVSTCPQNNTYFTRLNIFKLDNNSLICVTNNDGYCFPGSQVSFNAINGIEYYVLVHGFNNEKGEFTIKRTCVNLPPGDICTSAIQLNCGASLSGSTLNASDDPEMVLCGYNSYSFTPGIWYTFIGNGQNSTVSTCSQYTFDTRLTVYSGNCGGGLSCVGRNDDSCNDGSKITFPTITGQTYYVLVDGYYEQGTYTISRTCTTPINGDNCSTAILLPCQDTIFGSTLQAAIDPYAASCGFNSSPGVWYKIIGTGNLSKVATCSQYNFDTQLHLYSGACENLNCLGSNYDFCGEGSQVSLDTEMDSIYHILVSGTNEQGNFNLSHLCGDPLPGDVCISAIALPLNTILPGNTSLFSIDQMVCGTNSNSPTNTPGIWYSFEGDGNINEIVITGSASLNSVFNFMSGTCENMDCIGNGGDINGNNSFGSFATQVGVTYFVLVRGYYSQGSFTIKRTSTISSDVCSSAIELLCGDTISGSTLNSTIDNNLPVCGGFSIQSPSVWYKIIGNGQVNEVSTCSGFNFNTRISVFRNQETYSNDCNDTKICIASNDDFCGQGSKVSFPTLYGATYFILVHGVNGATGNFTISRNCITSPGDNCNIALELPCGSTINGTTVGALYDYNLPNCDLYIYEPGVWYKFTGNNQNNTISTCTAASFDTRIHIFKGSCNNLVCVTANDNYCDNKSTVVFYAESGQQYYVFVSGANFGSSTPGGGQGTFTITRECYIPVINDFCANATIINCGQTISGSLLNAGPDMSNLSCGDLNEVGIWYKFVGDGNNTFLNFTGTTLKSIYTGNCSSLNCFSYWGFSNTISFTTELATTYYIYVYKNPSTQNDFTITRTCSNKIVNDLCVNAIDIPCGIDVNGTTIGSAADGEKTSNEYPLCNKSINTPGVWYKFIGNGQKMEIFTCTSNNFFTDITVFQNNCNQLMCVGDEVVYYFCGQGSNINITTVVDKEYYVLIHGYNSTTGNFTIRRNCLTPSAGDNCENAININCGQTLSGTTAGKPYDNPEVPTCLSNECCYKERGVWYKFTGNGQVAKISTCTNNLKHTTIHIYKYDCSNLVCIDWSSYCNNTSFGAEIEFLSISNQQYYVFVEKDDESWTGSGPFSITYTCSPPAAATACATATNLACGQSITKDSYDSWLPDNVPFCGSQVISRSNWFKFTGTGQNTVISTCASQNINANTIISIFDGTCNNLNCVTSNNDFCGEQSSVSFIALNGIEYYVLVHGTDEFEPGTFTITRSCTNDNCASALTLPCDVEISGSTLNASSSNNLPFCGTSVTSPGVWYKFTGDGQNTTLNTCSFYNFNTQLKVYDGNCSNLNCIENNDDFCSFGSQVSFNTIPNTNYFIFVNGKFNTQGNFTLNRSCDSDTLYCQSSGISSQTEWISEINIAEFNNESNNSSYTYFSNDTINISRGGQSIINLKSDYSTTPLSKYYKLWIDFNKDGDFNDANETLLNVNNGDTLLIDTIFIPQNISTGVTRLRLSISLLNEPEPCESFPFGEVEDYNVDIKCNMVTSTFDSGSGSLRSVANCVDDGDYVLFSPSLNNQVINITNGPITVLGNWKWKADSLLNITISASSIQRALLIPQFKTLDLDNLKFYGGTLNSGSVIENSGSLIMRNCELYSNNNINNITLVNKGSLVLFDHVKIE